MSWLIWYPTLHDNPEGAYNLFIGEICPNALIIPHCDIFTSLPLQKVFYYILPFCINLQFNHNHIIYNTLRIIF